MKNVRPVETGGPFCKKGFWKTRKPEPREGPQGGFRGRSPGAPNGISGVPSWCVATSVHISAYLADRAIINVAVH